MESVGRGNITVMRRRHGGTFGYADDMISDDDVSMEEDDS